MCLSPVGGYFSADPLPLALCPGRLDALIVRRGKEGRGGNAESGR